MKAIRTSFLPVLVFCIAIARWSSAQSQLDAEAITKVSMCDLYTDSAKYQGKMVAVHESLAGSDFWIDDFSQQPCAYWTNVVMVYPAQVKPNPDFSLIQDDSFNTFFDSTRKGKNVSATFYGRFNAVFTWHDKKPIFVARSQEHAFGRKHGYGARIVLQPISDVTAHPMDRE